MASGQKRKFRFGLRSFLILMTLITILIALVAQPIFVGQQQRRLLAQLEKLDADISIGGAIRHPPSLGQTILRKFGRPPNRDFLYIVEFDGGLIENKDLELLKKVPYLFRLNLSRTNITDADLSSIAQCTNLYELDLFDTQVTDAGISKLKSLKKLAWLRTAETAVTYEALTDLDNHLPWIDSAEQRAIYEVRALGGTGFGVRRVLKTEDRPGPEYPGLYVPRGGEEFSDGNLHFGMPYRELKLGPTDFSHFAYLESLKNLKLVETEIEPDSFSDLPVMPNLTKIEIWSADISDVELQDLARQTQLEEFVLFNHARVTDKGIAELAKLRNLKSLEIRRCPRVTTKAIENLQKQLPDCKITNQDKAPPIDLPLRSIWKYNMQVDRPELSP